MLNSQSIEPLFLPRIHRATFPVHFFTEFLFHSKIGVQIPIFHDFFHYLGKCDNIQLEDDNEAGYESYKFFLDGENKKSEHLYTLKKKDSKTESARVFFSEDEDEKLPQPESHQLLQCRQHGPRPKPWIADRTIYNSERLEQKCFFNLFLEVSHKYLIARKSALEKTQLSDVLITDNLF